MDILAHILNNQKKLTDRFKLEKADLFEMPTNNREHTKFSDITKKFVKEVREYVFDFVENLNNQADNINKNSIEIELNILYKKIHSYIIDRNNLKDALTDEFFKPYFSTTKGLFDHITTSGSANSSKCLSIKEYINIDTPKDEDITKLFNFTVNNKFFEITLDFKTKSSEYSQLNISITRTP